MHTGVDNMLNKIANCGLAAALFAVCALPVAAADLNVEIINKTGFAIVEFYGSSSVSDGWEEDILGDRVLENNSSVTIDFDDGTGECVFDFLAKFEDGDQLQVDGIDVCTISEFTFE
jgi:hypothetical protein